MNIFVNIDSKWPFSCCKSNGTIAKVLGKHVVHIPWIHLIIKDSFSNNDLYGHYNNLGNICWQYHDEKGTLNNSSLSASKCQYSTIQDVKRAELDADKDGKREEISKYVVYNVLNDNNVPMCDVV